MDINCLHELEQWYQSQCDDDWEHQHGIEIQTLDNPGWSVQIDLLGTELENKNFDLLDKDVTQEFIDQSLGKVATPFVAASPISEDWYVCHVKDRKFCGAGGALQLEEIMRIFLRWAVEKM